MGCADHSFRVRYCGDHPPRQGPAMMRGNEVTPASEPISQADVTEAVSLPFLLAGGHPLRRQRCLLCGMLIGGREARAASVIDWRTDGCECGSVPTVTFLICADHPVDEHTDWMTPALQRWAAHHDGQS
jgi:hypothetical protein